MAKILDGLPAFFRYMNDNYGTGWALVGGCAAWVHIAQAERNMSEDVGVYREIFPKDIEVICKAAMKEQIEVSVGSRGVLKVDFVDSMHDGTSAALCDAAVVLDNGARTIPIQDIINRYTIATSTKQAVRQTRVYMLKEILARRRISPTAAQDVFNRPVVGNIFLSVKLKPVAKKE